MAGRPSKTTSEKAKQGTLRKSREREALNYEPLEVIPEPLKKLDDTAMVYFNFICEILLSNKTLTNADVPAVSNAAKYYSIFDKASDMVETEGYCQTTQSGYTAKNAHFQVMNDARKAIMDFENLYGFNLASRGRINIPKTKEKGKLDKLMEL